MNKNKVTNQNSTNPEFFTTYQSEISEIEYKIEKYKLDIIMANQKVWRL